MSSASPRPLITSSAIEMLVTVFIQVPPQQKLFATLVSVLSILAGFGGMMHWLSGSALTCSLSGGQTATHWLTEVHPDHLARGWGDNPFNCSDLI